MRKKLICLWIPLLILSACNPSKSETYAPSNYPVEYVFTADNDVFEQYPDPIVGTPKNENYWNVSDLDISEIDKNRKLIAFSFDDAPARTIESILTTFTSYNEQNPDCKAFCTLFFNGCRFDNATVHQLNSAVALGMELGNHTYSHLDLTTLTPEKLQWEIDETDRLLEKADGKTRHLLRAPFGKINDVVKQLAQTPILNWSIDTLDWTGKTAEEIFNAVFSNKADGAIVLMHDGYTPTVTALKRLLPALKEENYQVVSISQLAKANECTLKNGSVYIRARKPQNRK